MSVEQLFQRYRTTGDPQALGQVFDQVAAQLLSLALHLCQNIADAEDALQATFLVAIAKAQQFEHGRALLPWLTGILTLHCRKSFERRARRREQELTDDAAPVASAPLPPAVAEQQELVAQLRSHVEALPDEQRQVLLLQLQHGLQPAEIAEVLGVPSGTVRVRLHRGLRALRRLLPSGLAAWLFAALPARGTAAVRQEIVAAAQRALPVGAAATSLVWLPFLAMKKLAAVVIVALAAGTWMLLQNSDPLVEQAARAGTGSSMRAEQVAAATPPIELRDVADAPAMQRQQLAFSVLVVDENERPLVDATVRCWQEDHEPTLQRTGADGRAEFAAVERAGGLLVQAPACMQVLQALPHLVGEHRVVLGAGKRVAGQMLVDGKPAPAGLQLAISGKPFESQAPLPPSIAELLRDWQPHSTTATDAAGHFAFRGLADDWQGSLDLPRTHWLLPIAGRDFDNNDYDDLWFLPLAVPCEDLVVATTRLPSVEGRVVWADTDESVAHAGLMVLARFADGEVSPCFGCGCDAAGRFAAGLYPSHGRQRDRWCDPTRRPAVINVQLWASAPGSLGDARVELDAEQVRAGGEVIVRLQRAPTTHFLAQDANGTPIAGARVQSNRVSKPTGQDGRGTFAGPKERILVGAPGYQVVAAQPVRSASGTVDDPLVFVLQRGNRLEVRVRTGTGEVPAVCSVILRSKHMIFTGGVLQTELHRALGSSDASGSWSPSRDSPSEGESVNPMQLDHNGEAVLESLLPDEPCRLAVCDQIGTELLMQELVTPASGQTRTVELLVTQQPRTLHGRVLARDGQPLGDARVHVQVGGRNDSIDVAADGTFAPMRILNQEPLTLIAQRTGFVAQQRQGLSPEHDSEEVVFALEPGHKVTVQVLDEQDTTVPVPWITVEGAGPVPVHAQKLALDEFTCADLPQGNVTFSCELGSHHFEVVHDTANERAVLRVPRPARVLVLPPPGLATPAKTSFDVAVTRLDAPEQPLRMWLPEGNGAEPQLLLPGRYRFALVQWEQRGGEIEHFEVGTAAEVELPAGVVTRVQLH